MLRRPDPLTMGPDPSRRHGPSHGLSSLSQPGEARRGEGELDPETWWEDLSPGVRHDGTAHRSLLGHAGFQHKGMLEEKETY